MIDSFEAAAILEVPILALGQIVFDGKLKVYQKDGDYVFDELEVRALLDKQPAYLAKLK